MKAISIFQPWATLIAQGYLGFTTSSRKTRYRGPIAIHAHATEAPPGVYLDENITRSLIQCGYSAFTAPTVREHQPLPHGFLIATAILSEVIPWTEATASQKKEYDRFGSIVKGRYLWILNNPKLLKTPKSVRGRPAVFDISL